MYVFYLTPLVCPLRFSLEEGRSVFAYDIEYNREFMDIMSPQGYALAIFAVLNTKRAGGLTLAPVCSTWVFMIL